jgi:hypothetical protein
LIVHHVENLAIHSLDEPGEHYGFRAIVHVSQRKAAAPAKVHEKPKGIYTYKARDRLLARTENNSGPHNRIGQATTLMVNPNQLILFEFAIRVCVMELIQIVFQGAGFIPNFAPPALESGVYGKRAHIYKPFKTLLTDQSVQQIPGGDYRPLKAPRE